MFSKDKSDFPGIVVTLKDGTIEEQFDDLVDSIGGVVSHHFVSGNTVSVRCEFGSEGDVITAINAAGHSAERE